MNRNNTNLLSLRNKINEMKIERSTLIKISKENNIKKETLKKDIVDHAKARELLLGVLLNIQDDFSKKVEALVTKAIKIVFFYRDFEFKLLFEEKRNNIECRPVIMEDGIEYTPKDDLGGSILDIIGFALRVVLITLEEPKKRLFIALDEPFRWLGDLRLRAGQMVAEICKGLGLQMLFVTHDKDLVSIADTVYHIKHNKKKGSYIDKMVSNKE